jgi:hypothetical protein
VLIWLLVVAVPLGFLAWDIADLFADPKTEREVMGENFLEHDLYAQAVGELVDQHGRDARLLDAYVDLRSAQFSIVTGDRTATVEGFGQRGGGDAYTGGGPVEDYERKIADGELDTAMGLGELSIGAPRRMVARLRAFEVSVDDVVSMRLRDGAWSVLVRTGPDPTDNRRFSAGRAGEDLKPSG